MQSDGATGGGSSSSVLRAWASLNACTAPGVHTVSLPTAYCAPRPLPRHGVQLTLFVPPEEAGPEQEGGLDIAPLRELPKLSCLTIAGVWRGGCGVAGPASLHAACGWRDAFLAPPHFLVVGVHWWLDADYRRGCSSTPTRLLHAHLPHVHT